LRWDLKQMLDLALSEGLVCRNPATLLFIPKGVRRPSQRVMNFEEVKKLFGLLEQWGLLISKLAIYAGLRPGEIFGLKWGKLIGESAEIHQRVYRCQIETPKTHNSIREVALPKGLVLEIERWRKISVNAHPEAWVFPSETGKTPLSKNNCWRRCFEPKLEPEGLGWVNFQVMRRTHSTLMNCLKIDPKLVADQLGHTMDVSQNIYTQLGMERRKPSSYWNRRLARLNGATWSCCNLLKRWSGRRGSNPRRPAWEAGILPLNYSRSLD
jgi:integrase